MNKAEAIEAMKNKYVYWQNAIDIINSIQPTTDEAWEVVANSLPYSVEDLKNKLAFSVMSADFNKPQKVVIPKFVAEWWECLTDIDGLFDYILKYRWNEYAANDDFIPIEVLDWVFDNNDSFVLALRLITGELDYEVEKEKLYYVFDKTTGQYLGYDKVQKHAWWLSTQNSGARSKLTEQQIKAIDERYFAFAVEVEDAE